MSKVLLLVPESSSRKIIEEVYLSKLPPHTDYLVRFTQFRNHSLNSIHQIREFVKESLQEEFTCYDYIICCDGTWFQALYRACKPTTQLGYVIPKNQQYLLYCPSPLSLIYNKDDSKVRQCFNALCNHIAGTYTEPGKGIIHSSMYADNPNNSKSILNTLKNYSSLTCDIETRSLCHIDAGLVSIAFAWDKHNGAAIYVNNEPEIIDQLRDFFREFKGRLIFHNISYDVYVLIYVLYMKNPLDQQGLLNGLHIFLDREWEDTKLITYLATNSTDGNVLGLKPNTQEFSGDYAVEVTDIDSISKDNLLKYNLIDCLSTWYLYEKYYQKMCQSQELGIYTEIFKPAVKDIIQMQLTGMPINMKRVKEVKAILQKDSDDAINSMMSLSLVRDFEVKLNKDWVDRKNTKLKKKKVSYADADEHFNPRSNLQLQELLYDVLKLPILKTTKSKAPACDGDTLKDLQTHTTDPDVITLLKSLVQFKEVDKILGSFIPAFEKAHKYGGWHWLYGHFNLGGTVSGRLSSSDPNLQNLPATGSVYAKVIKSCFQAPPGWLFIGIDFASLEDRISALTTKDPNKLAVYQHGYDGHCFRAFNYFKDEMQDIASQMEEISKEGQTYKVTLDDGSVEFINEHNPKLKEYQHESSTSI